jgi:mannosyltransferase
MAVDETISASLTRPSRIVGALIAFTALGSWLPPLPSSLWADEGVTHWIIKDGWSQTLHRAAAFEGESPLYFLILRGFRSVLGSTEIALRAPSLFAIAVATALIWRIGRRLADSETGLLAALAFAGLEFIVFAAADARSYAFALLALLGSTLALIRWADERNTRDAILYIALATTALHLHYFTATALIAHAAHVWARRDRLRPLSFAVAWVTIAALLTPAVPQINALLGRRESLELPHDVTLNLFFTALFPVALVGSMALGIVCALRWGRPTLRPPTLQPGGAALAGALWIVPPVVLAGVTLFSSTRIFEGRYLFFATPGLALVAGVAMRSISPATARLIVAAILSAVSLFTFVGLSHTGDNWGAASKVERALAGPHTRVLYRSTLVESAQIDWLTAPDKRAYLLSMTSRSPFDGKIDVLPHTLAPESERYLESLVTHELLGARRILLVNGGLEYEAWLEGRLRGYSARKAAGSDAITVIVFERR